MRKWAGLTLDRVHWQVFVYTVIYLLSSIKGMEFLSFSRKTASYRYSYTFFGTEYLPAGNCIILSS